VEAIEALGVDFLKKICIEDKFPHPVFNMLGGLKEEVEKINGMSSASHQSIITPAPHHVTFQPTQHHGSSASTNTNGPATGVNAAPAYTHTSQQLVSTKEGVIVNGVICVFWLSHQLSVPRKDGTELKCSHTSDCKNLHSPLNTITSNQASQAVRTSTGAGTYLQEALLLAITGQPEQFK
jgi:hypothetical protein